MSAFSLSTSAILRAAARLIESMTKIIEIIIMDMSMLIT